MENNDKPNAEESVVGSQKKKSYSDENVETPKGKDEEVSPLGKDVVPAFYVVYNTKLNSFGLIGAAGFLDDRVRAYGALHMAERQMDEYYAKMDKARDSIITRATNFDAKKVFRNFIKRK